MFSKATKKIYNKKKNLNFIIPIEYTLTQTKLKKNLINKKQTKKNIFNINTFNNNITSTKQNINNKKKKFDTYYKLISNSFLNNKTTNTLLKNNNFTTKNKKIYTTNPFYEIEIKTEIKLIHYKNSKYTLSGTIKKNKKNTTHNIEIVKKLLAQLNYITKNKTTNTNTICTTIPKFQTKKLTPKKKE